MLILGGRGLSEGNEHVWLFTRRVLLPLESSSAHESTNFVMLDIFLLIGVILAPRFVQSARPVGQSGFARARADTQICCPSRLRSRKANLSRILLAAQHALRGPYVRFCSSAAAEKALPNP